MADVVESVERQAMLASGATVQSLRGRLERHPMRTALLALGAGFLVGKLVGRERADD
jgi:hypothetical protein